MEKTFVENSRTPESRVNLQAIEENIDQKVAVKPNIRKQIATRLAGVVLVGTMFLSACSPIRLQETSQISIEPTNLSAQVIKTPALTTDKETHAHALDEERVVPDQDLEPYDIKLPDNVKNDMAKVIWYALQNGAAKNIDRRDLYHCHVLIPYEVYKQKYELDVYKGTLSNYINSVVNDYSGLLCHSQELTSNGLDQTKRNIVVMKGKEPYILHALPGEGLDMTDLEKKLNKELSTPLSLYFDLDPNGEITLPDGRRVNAVVEHPETITTWTTPRNMQVDLPAANKP